MKKALILFFLLFIPFNVFSKEKIYELIIDPSFISCIENNDEDACFEKSKFSIRDYLIYQKIKDQINNEKIDITDDINIYNINSYRVYLLQDYNQIKIKKATSNKMFNSLNFSSLDSFLDSSIYHYYLFLDTISKEDSSLDFVRGNDNNYAKIISRNSAKTLLNIDIVDDNITFHVPDNVSVGDNTSFVLLNNNSSRELDYVSIVFSEEEKFHGEVIHSFFASTYMIFIVLLFAGILVFSILNHKKK